MSVTYSSTPWGKIPTVDYYADLPSALEYIGRICLVLNSSGVWPINYKEKGIYYSDGTVWSKKSGVMDQILDGVTNTDINGWLVGDGVKVSTAPFTPVAIGGLDTQIQFNDGGVLGGDSGLIWDKTNKKLDIKGKTFPVQRVERTVASGSGFYSTSVFVTKTAGAVSDGFGGGLVFAANDRLLCSIGGVRNGADNSGKLEFNVYKTGTFNEGVMFINSDGLVSIGEDTPTAPLNLSLSGSSVAQNTMLKLRTRSRTDGRTADIDFAITSSTTHILGRFGAVRTSRATAADTDFAWSLYSGGKLTERMRLRDDGLLTLPTDNTGIILGAGSDASIYYDGTNMIINPKVVGSGIVDVSGTLQTDGYNSSDGSTGITTTKSWVDNGGNTHDVTVKDGLITAWTVT